MQITLLMLGIFVFLMTGIMVKVDLKIISPEKVKEVQENGPENIRLFGIGFVMMIIGLKTTIYTVFFILCTLYYFNWITLTMAAISTANEWMQVYEMFARPTFHNEKTKLKKITESAVTWIQFIYSAVFIAMLLLSKM